VTADEREQIRDLITATIRQTVNGDVRALREDLAEHREDMTGELADIKATLRTWLRLGPVLVGIAVIVSALAVILG